MLYGEDNKKMGKTAEEYRQEGNALMKSNKLQLAINSYSRAIALDENDHLSYSNRAKANIDLGHYYNALHDSEACIEKNSQFWKGYHRKVTSLKLLKNYDQAAKTCSDALELLQSDGSADNKEGIELIKKLKEEIRVIRKKLKKGITMSELDSFETGKEELKERIKGLTSTLTPFFQVIVNSDMTSLRKFVEQDKHDVNSTANIDIGFTSRVNALLVALLVDNKEAFQFLLQKG